MGRTNPTYRQTVQQRREEWNDMRRWLRKHQRPAYDQLWTHADEFSDVAGEANPRDPMEGILMSMLMGQQLAIEELQKRVDELENSPG